MSYKKKGQLSSVSERAKHLRQYMKRMFWKRERKAENVFVEDELFRKDNLKWSYNELLKTLVIMSLPYKDQANIYGIGDAANEMCLDFDTYFSNIKLYREKELISADGYEALQGIQALLDSWAEEKSSKFYWEMENHKEEWDVLREKAKKTLKTLKMDHLTVRVVHQNTWNWKGRIISQSSKIALTKKDKQSK